MENSVLPCMPVGRFYGLDLKKGNGRLGEQAMEVARLVNEENNCRFKVQREEHWIHARPTWSITVRNGCWSYFLTKLAASICSGIGCDTSS